MAGLHRVALLLEWVDHVVLRHRVRWACRLVAGFFCWTDHG